MTVIVRPGGEVRAIYDDALAPLVERGATVSRASYVEPCVGGWSADLAPVGGPILGPFRLRQEALEEEMTWLRRNLLGVP